MSQLLKFPLSDKAVNRIYEIDCLQFMKTLPDECVDLIICDSPYNDLTMFRGGKLGQSSVLGSHGWFNNDQISEEKFNVFFLAVLKELYRVLKPHSHIYIFCNYKVVERFKSMVIQYFQWVNLLVWDKVRMGLGWCYRNQWELIILASKGKNKIKIMNKGNVLRFTRVANNQHTKGHPTPKSESLIVELIANSSQVGDLVLDPFMGSGTTAVAALKLKRNFIGCELENKFVQLANARLEQLQSLTALKLKEAA